MTKFQNFQNSNRYDQNVGKVLNSRKMAAKNPKSLFGAKISLTAFFLDFLDPRGGSAYWPLFGRQAFILHTPVCLAETGVTKHNSRGAVFMTKHDILAVGLAVDAGWERAHAAIDRLGVRRATLKQPHRGTVARGAGRADRRDPPSNRAATPLSPSWNGQRRVGGVQQVG